MTKRDEEKQASSAHTLEGMTGPVMGGQRDEGRPGGDAGAEGDQDKGPETTATIAASPEDMMIHFQQTGDIPVEEFDAMIRKQLEQTDGVFSFDFDLSAVTEEDTTSDVPEPVTPHGLTGDISAREVAANALPFMETGAMPSAPELEDPTAHDVWEAPDAPPSLEATGGAPSPWEDQKTRPLTDEELKHIVVPVASSPVVDSVKKQDPPAKPATAAGPYDTTTEEEDETQLERRYQIEVDPVNPLPSGDELSVSQLNMTPPADPMIGKVVVDRYRIVDLLGKGGMGKVFRANQLGLSRDVALKLLHPQLATEVESRTRFQREAQSMTRFSHPNVASVFDFGEWEGQYFIAMELLIGRPLSKFIPKSKGMENQHVLQIMEEVCQGLAAAHGAGIIHRDLKPENIVIIDESGVVKLVDFGLAMLQDTPEEERLTVEGMTIGTPHYMSPEQCQGMEVDERSDIYSLGCILYEMLCGDIPFWGDTLMAIMMQQLFAEPIPPSQRKGGVKAHPYLDSLAMRCLSKAPDDRPQSAEEFLEELRKANDDADPSGRSNLASLGDRNARASALGLPHLSGRIVRAPTKFAEVLFYIVEQPEQYTDSLTMAMWGNGFTVKQLVSIDEVLEEMPGARPGGLVIDITHDPVAVFSQLIDCFKEGVFAGIPVTIVGPDDSFDMMTLSLELGAFDYVPVSQTKQKLPKSLRRIAKKKARQKK